eukprot:1351857-Prymnesium_polylepis.1
MPAKSDETMPERWGTSAPTNEKKARAQKSAHSTAGDAPERPRPASLKKTAARIPCGARVHRLRPVRTSHMDMDMLCCAGFDGGRLTTTTPKRIEPRPVTRKDTAIVETCRWRSSTKS